MASVSSDAAIGRRGYIVSLSTKKDGKLFDMAVSGGERAGEWRRSDCWCVGGRGWQEGEVMGMRVPEDVGQSFEMKVPSKDAL